MGLKQRKRIKNMSMYADGKDDSISPNKTDTQSQQNQPTSKGIDGSQALASKGVAGLQGITSITSNFMNQNKNVPTGDQMMTESGTSEGSVMGVGYTRQNNIDSGKYESEVNSSGLGNTMGSTMSGASAGASVAGPWGAVVGGAVGLVSGLVGWGSSKRKLQKRLHDAKQLTSRTNTFNRSGAMSTGLQNEYYQDYGNTQDDVLYS